MDPLGPTGTSWAAGAASTGRGSGGERQKSAFPLFDTKEIRTPRARELCESAGLALCGHVVTMSEPSPTPPLPSWAFIALGFVWSLLVAIGFTSCQRWKQRQVREKHT